MHGQIELSSSQALKHVQQMIYSPIPQKPGKRVRLVQLPSPIPGKDELRNSCNSYISKTDSTIALSPQTIDILQRPLTMAARHEERC